MESVRLRLTLMLTLSARLLMDSLTLLPPLLDTDHMLPLPMLDVLVMLVMLDVLAMLVLDTLVLAIL